MALTTATAGLTPQLWDDKFFTSYVRANQFSKYMGTSENSIIQVKEDLTKKNGESITFALVNDLTGAGVSGNSLLEGNEEALGSRSFKLSVALARHGVAVHEWDEQKSAIDLRNAARPQLKTWLLKKDRTDIINALGSINGTAYASANSTARNAWMVDNADRVLVGKLKSNYSATHATALANIDATDDKLTADMVSLAKRVARTASPSIRPIMVDNDGEWYVMFCNSYAFRDLKKNLQTVHQYAETRGKSNPLFTDGDLVWDGVIIREIPEIGVYADVGAGGAADVGPNYLCGAQALSFGWAQRPTTRTEQRDYGAVNGVAIQQIRGLAKTVFGKGASDTDDLVDHGVVTVFASAEADA